jgi:simple sugar transport system permease protein
MRLERREHVPAALAVLAPAAAVLAALAVCAVPLAAVGADPLVAYLRMAEGAFGSTLAVTETLTRATPLVLTGLAAAIAFRARLWNIGAEGQLYAGALAAVAVGGGAIVAPPALLVLLVLAAGAAAGALVMLVPTLLRVRLQADEVVTTLLLNFVVILFVSMMLEGPMRDPMGMGWPQSAPLLPEAELPKLLPRTRLHAGLLLALALVLLAAFVMARTVLGVAIRATGDAPAAARFAGIRTGRVLIVTGLVSGAFAGLAGAVEVAGLKGYLTRDLSPGHGYAGIIVAMLAGLEPLAVPLAAGLVAAVFVGADSMSRAMGVSSYIANLLVATSLLTTLLAGLAVRYRIRR